MKPIVPWGRSLSEYNQMFNLTAEDHRLRILGCGDGPASFNAEMTAAGCSVVSVDPIYAFSGVEIMSRFEAVLTRRRNSAATPPAGALPEKRRSVTRHFLADYEIGRKEGRYHAAALPCLPFPDHAFDLALCSNLLFLYSEQLSGEFHVQSVLELARVAREVRIFPLVSLEQVLSPHLELVRARTAAASLASEILTVDYRTPKGAGQQMLRIFTP